MLIIRWWSQMLGVTGARLKRLAVAPRADIISRPHSPLTPTHSINPFEQKHKKHFHFLLPTRMYCRYMYIRSARVPDGWKENSKICEIRIKYYTCMCILLYGYRLIYGIRMFRYIISLCVINLRYDTTTRKYLNVSCFPVLKERPLLWGGPPCYSFVKEPERDIARALKPFTTIGTRAVCGQWSERQ